MDGIRCTRCGVVRETGDNFCRNCGHQFTINLPAVTAGNLPAIRRAIPPSLVGSVAVLAVGTGLEWLARRLASSAARAAGRALIGLDRAPDLPKGKTAAPPDATVDEFLYVRRVQLRR